MEDIELLTDESESCFELEVEGLIFDDDTEVEDIILEVDDEDESLEQQYSSGIDNKLLEFSVFLWEVDDSSL